MMICAIAQEEVIMMSDRSKAYEVAAIAGGKDDQHSQPD
jgi:hypothetical protein